MKVYAHRQKRKSQSPRHVHRDPMRIARILNEPEKDDGRIKDDIDDGERETPSTSTSSDSSASRVNVKRRICRLPRPPCKKYDLEQADWIWYHRTDIGECWNTVEAHFDQQFSGRREKGGLQCKF